MPVGAAQPLIDVFQNISQQKEREKQFSIEEARMQGQQAYQQAMEQLRAQHEAAYEQGMLNVQERALANQEAAAKREENRAAEAERRLTAQDITTRNARVQGVVDKWSKEGAPLPALIAGMPPEEQDLVKQSVQAWRTAQYKDRLEEAQRNASQTAEGRINSVMPEFAASTMGSAALMGVPVPTNAIQKIAQIHYEEQQNALKEVGAPPTDDDWMTAKSPYWEAQERKFQMAEKQSEARTELLTSQAKRQQQLVEMAPEAAKSIQDYRKAMLDINRGKAQTNEKFQQWKMKHQDWFDGERLNVMKMNAATAQQRARTYKTVQDRIAANKDSQEARFYAQQDYRSKESEIRATNAHLSTVQQVANALEQRGFGKVEMKPEQQGTFLGFGGRTVDVAKMPDGSGGWRSLTPDENKQYQAYLSAKEELNPNNPTSLQNRVNELESERAALQRAGYGTSISGGPVGPSGSVQKSAQATARGKTDYSKMSDADLKKALAKRLMGQ